MFVIPLTQQKLQLKTSNKCDVLQTEYINTQIFNPHVVRIVHPGIAVKQYPNHKATKRPQLFNDLPFSATEITSQRSMLCIESKHASAGLTS